MFWENNVNRLILGSAALVFVYVTLRAVLVDITHDEAYTFYNVKHFWYAEALCTGNTHWLNSLAIKLAITMGGERLWQVRWFSLFSALVFLFIVMLWIRDEKNTTPKLLASALILFNPYILDYFSLSRGYAQGLMLEVAAVLFYILARREPHRYKAFWALLCAGLSTLANWGFVYFFVAFVLLYVYAYYLRKGYGFLKTWHFYRDMGWIAGILLLFARAYVFIMKCSGDVTGAGTETLNGYFHILPLGLIFQKFELAPWLLNVLSYACLLFAILSASYGVVMRKVHKQDIYFACSIILLGILGLTIAGHLVAGIVLPYFRSAIFLFPTTVLCFVYFIYFAIPRTTFRDTIMVALSIMLAINLIFSVNLKTVFDCYGYTNLKDSFDALAKLNAKRVGLSPELYGGFRNYYQMTDDYHYDFEAERLNTCSQEGWQTQTDNLFEYDFVALFPPYNLDYYKKHPARFKAMHLFKETGIIILKVEPANSYKAL